MMKTLLQITGLIFFAGWIILAGGKQAAAATLPYNPSNIIRDDIFINSGTMNASSIQQFLESQGSCLATASPSDLGSPSGQTAAQLIAQSAASANAGRGINPQVILTTLQKEWSLVTKSCASLEALYGGYAGGPHVYLNRALGYNVPDVLGVGSCLYTFYAQLMGNTCSGDSYLSGPSSMRRTFDNNQVGPGGSYAFPNSFTVQEYSTQAGNITISPVTKATAVLYRYTPYAYYGNYNFFNIFQSFFGNPICATSLTVIKGTDPESAVLFEGVRYPINSIAALTAWGLDCVPVTYMTQVEYNAYPIGQSITRLFKEAGNPPVYIAQGGVRRHLRTSLYVDQMGLNGELYSELPPRLIANLPYGNPLGFLVRATGRSEIYLAQASVKYYVPNIPTIEAWGFPISELVEANATYVDSLPTAGNLSTLVKGSGAPIYVASLRQFYWAPNPGILQDWNMQGYSVTLLDDAFLNSLPKGGNMTRLTRGTGPDTYYIENKKRYHVANIQAASRLQGQYGPVTPMSDTAISSLPLVGSKK